MLRSLEQDRAKYAMDCIREVKEKEFQKEYKSYVRHMPMLILTNGLGNALAFIKSKKNNKASDQFYTHLNKWLKEMMIISGDDVLNWITDKNTSSIQVQRATDEMLALLNWMKRFAEAELESK
ncbi:MAG: type III-B CRISPR module-associated protein Cmr5 [Candidatus Methanomethyliaceae archaeon]